MSVQIGPHGPLGDQWSPNLLKHLELHWLRFLFIKVRERGKKKKFNSKMWPHMVQSGQLSKEFLWTADPKVFVLKWPKKAECHFFKSILPFKMPFSYLLKKIICFQEVKYRFNPTWYHTFNRAVVHLEIIKITSVSSTLLIIYFVNPVGNNRSLQVEIY